MEPNPYNLNTRAELIVLRNLVECFLSVAPREMQAAVMATFSTACESTMSALLATATRETTIEAMDTAQAAQLQRLVNRGLPTRPPRAD